MSNVPGGEERKLSNHDIHLVQIRIEQCLQHYMSKKEVVNTLVVQDNIQPGFTELVWQRLEEENQEFFKAYYLKLLVKDQITEFNRLLLEQVELMHQIGSSGIGPILPCNGSNVSSSQHKHNQPAEVFDAPVGSSSQQSLFLSQNPNMGPSQSTMVNGKIVKTEGGGGISQPFDFGPNRNYAEKRRNMIGDASVSSFSSVDSSAHHINEAALLDASSFGFLSQFQQNLSFPEFASDFPTDLLDSYCRAPFLGVDGNNLVDPDANMESMDPESANLRYNCFGGD